jgi:hypothetical protein
VHQVGFYYTEIRYYFEFRKHDFLHFPQVRNGRILNSRYYFSFFESLRKRNFLEEQVDLAKTVVNFTDSEMHMLAKIFFLKIPFLKVGCVLN